MNKWRSKKRDGIQVIAGKDKSVKGELLRVLKDERRVCVKGVNICSRHRKPSIETPGQLVKEERSIHTSNAMLVDSSDDKQTHIGMTIVDGKKVRVSKQTWNEIA